MKLINYMVTNKSSGHVSVSGRAPFTIPGNCEDLTLSLPDTDGIKATIQRLKREYPLISFAVVEPVAEENADSGDGTGDGKATLEAFSKSCEVKPGKQGKLVVVYEGKGYNVVAEKPEDAILIAFDQYSVANK